MFIEIDDVLINTDNVNFAYNERYEKGKITKTYINFGYNTSITLDCSMDDFKKVLTEAMIQRRLNKIRKRGERMKDGC